MSLLRRRAIVAYVKVGGKEPFSRDSLNTDKSNGVNLSVNFLKNSTGNPSGPGALLDCIALIAFDTSSRESGESNCVAVIVSITGLGKVLKKFVHFCVVCRKFRFVQ